MNKFGKYEKYKISELNYIGKIPYDWEIAKIKQIFQERNKKNKPILSKERLSLSIDKGVTLYSEKTTNLDRYKDDFTQYKLAYSNDLVLNSMNMIVGAAGISKYFGCVSPAYYVLYSRDLTKYNPQYFAYFFQTRNLQGKLHSIGKGIMAIERGNGRINTCRLKVARQDLKNLAFPVPSIGEQEQIVRFIRYKERQIDKLIKKQKQLIELLEEKKKILITKAITKGLNKDVQMKDSGIKHIGKVPINWNIGKVKQYYKFQTGFTPDTTNPSFYDNENGFNWITISDMQSKYTPTTTATKVSLAYIKMKHPKISPKNSLLYSFKLSVGQTAFVQEDIYTNEAIATFLDNSNVNLRFLYYSSFLIANNAKENIYSAKILNQKLIANAYIVFPPLEEQMYIADFLDDKCDKLDTIIKQKKILIDKLQEYKKNLISNAVTGQIDVRDYEIPATDDNIDLDEIENLSEDDTEIISEVEYANC